MGILFDRPHDVPAQRDEVLPVIRLECASVETGVLGDEYGTAGDVSRLDALFQQIDLAGAIKVVLRLRAAKITQTR